MLAPIAPPSPRTSGSETENDAVAVEVSDAAAPPQGQKRKRGKRGGVKEREKVARKAGSAAGAPSVNVARQPFGAAKVALKGAAGAATSAAPRAGGGAAGAAGDAAGGAAPVDAAGQPSGAEEEAPKGAAGTATPVGHAQACEYVGREALCQLSGAAKEAPKGAARAATPAALRAGGGVAMAAGAAAGATSADVAAQPCGAEEEAPKGAAADATPDGLNCKARRNRERAQKQKEWAEKAAATTAETEAGASAPSATSDATSSAHAEEGSMLARAGAFAGEVRKAADRLKAAATRRRVCDIMVKLTPRFDGVNRTKVLGYLYSDTECKSIYARVAEDEDLQGFRLVCSGKVIPNSDLTIGETNLVLYAPATVHVCLPIRRAGLSDDKGIEAHGEDDDDGSKDGADQSPRGKGDGGKGGGAADGGAASGGGMGGHGGSSSSGGGALGDLGRINRIVVKSDWGHNITINNMSLGITARALYESIAERCEGTSADALTVIHFGRPLPNDNSELHTTTLGSSQMDKLGELHLAVVVRKRSSAA